jgi:hypothetical protein
MISADLARAVGGTCREAVLGQEFNLPLRYDAQVDRQAKGEAMSFLTNALRK